MKTKEKVRNHYSQNAATKLVCPVEPPKCRLSTRRKKKPLKISQDMILGYLPKTDKGLQDLITAKYPIVRLENMKLPINEGIKLNSHINPPSNLEKCPIEPPKCRLSMRRKKKPLKISQDMILGYLPKTDKGLQDLITAKYPIVRLENMKLPINEGIKLNSHINPPSNLEKTNATKESPIMSNQKWKRSRGVRQKTPKDDTESAAKDEPISSSSKKNFKSSPLRKKFTSKIEEVRCKCGFNGNASSSIKKKGGPGKVDNKEYQCTLCSGTTARHSSVKEPMEFHHNKSYECTECTFSTKSCSNLAKHQMTHKNKGQFKCTYCPHAATSSCSLKRHMQTHEPAKTFKCDQCSFATKLKWSLIRHMKLHVTSQPFKCADCSFSSMQKNYVIRHIVKTHKESVHSK